MIDPASGGALTTPAREDEGTLSEPGREHDDPKPKLVEDELLIEDVSIDGMCGVY